MTKKSEEIQKGDMLFTIGFRFNATEEYHSKIIELLESGRAELQPAYIKDKDGHIKILEVSVVLRQENKN